MMKEKADKLNKTKLQAHCEGHPPSRYMSYRDFLANLFQTSKDSFIGVTYRSFSKALGLGESNVIDHIIKGRRPLSSKAADKISDALKLSGTEKKYLRALVQYEEATNSGDRDEALKTLFRLKERTLSSVDQKELEYFTEWYHPVIGEMCRLPGFQSDPHWIADNIVPRIRPEQAQASLSLLEELGIIVFDNKRKTWVRTAKDPSTSPETFGHAVRGFHEKMLEIAKYSLTEVHSTKRDISALSVCVDAKTAKQIKDKINTLQREILELEKTCREPEKTYQVNIQLFPTSKSK